jgi:hypothetical protein
MEARILDLDELGNDLRTGQGLAWLCEGNSWNSWYRECRYGIEKEFHDDFPPKIGDVAPGHTGEAPTAGKLIVVRVVLLRRVGHFLAGGRTIISRGELPARVIALFTRILQEA